MLIDWFTVGAQLINFLVLVWLLKRFLYKPVLNAIDAREKRIAAELSDADAAKANARKERDDFQAKSSAFDQQRAALLAKAVDDARAEHDRLLAETHKAVDEQRANGEASLRDEWTRMAGEITRLATREVFEIARKALADLATVSLEERIGEVFTRRLRDMDARARESLSRALVAASEHALVRSTFDLGSVQRAAIQNALNEDFSADVHVRFETAPAGICGIELTVGGQKVAWSIAEYLSLLEEKVSALVNGQAPKADTAKQPDRADAPELRSVA
jgi:F-type H+-transporting ATPase subunit b